MDLFVIVIGTVVCLCWAVSIIISKPCQRGTAIILVFIRVGPIVLKVKGLTLGVGGGTVLLTVIPIDVPFSRSSRIKSGIWTTLGLGNTILLIDIRCHHITTLLGGIVASFPPLVKSTTVNEWRVKGRIFLEACTNAVSLACTLDVVPVDVVISSFQTG